MATAHKKNTGHSAYGKADEDKNTMLVFTFFAALVAVALVAFILVEAANHHTGETSGMANNGSGVSPGESTPATPAPAANPGVSTPAGAAANP